MTAVCRLDRLVSGRENYCFLSVNLECLVVAFCGWGQMMIRTYCAGAILTCVIAAATAVPAAAQTPAVTVSSPSVATGGPYEMGYQFTANSAISVTNLGAFDYGSNGLTDTHTLSLWAYDIGNNTSSLLSSAVIGPATASTLVGSFQYVAIAPVTLTAGNSYVVAASNYGGGDPFAFNEGTFDPAINFVQSRFAVGSGSVFPANTNGTTGYFGGSFEFVASTAPEPASWALMILGFGIAGTALRRRAYQPRSTSVAFATI